MKTAGTRVNNSVQIRQGQLDKLRVKFHNAWENHWKLLSALISVKILLKQLDYSLSISMRR